MMTDPTPRAEGLLRNVVALANQMAEEADHHPLRLVEVSQALFVDQIVRPLRAALAASPTAPGLDVAWDELRDDLASLAYDLNARSPNGPAEFRGEIGVVIARHRDTIEEARRTLLVLLRETREALAFGRAATPQLRPSRHRLR